MRYSQWHCEWLGCMFGLSLCISHRLTEIWLNKIHSIWQFLLKKVFYISTELSGMANICNALVNTLRLWRNCHHFADDIFKCIFLNEYIWILFKISLKFVPTFWINNNPAVVQIMAWHRPGDKALSEPMMVSLLAHICITQPQWVKTIFWLKRENL